MGATNVALMPASKLSEGLAVMIKEKSSEERIPVIVTILEDITPETVSEKVKKTGLRVENVLGGSGGPVPVITGSIRVGDLPRLMAAPEVSTIDYDSETHAL